MVSHRLSRPFASSSLHSTSKIQIHTVQAFCASKGLQFSSFHLLPDVSMLSNWDARSIDMTASGQVQPKGPKTDFADPDWL